ncbi:MAG: protein kinase [Polyangiaceae bacterium]|nr:protein kinase [Polyangiaceae bacterium]
MDKGNDPLLGTLVSGRYRVKKLLGEGGMGQVYLAEHEAIEKTVALKVLKREYSQKADIVTRFQQEAISASRIKHPNVLDVFDFGQLEDGSFYLAMEFLEGHDLADDLQKVRFMPPDRGVRIALQICRALAAAHAKGVVHRDMKPENVFLQHTGDGEEVVKIVDFGIAQLRSQEEAAASEPKRRRLTKTGMIFGTPEYMSPEQAAGKKADLRVDIYAVGVILYEMFTGAVPHTGETFMAVLAATLSDPVPPMRGVSPDLTISPELEAVVLRALAKQPDERFQSMSEVAHGLLATPEGARVGGRMGSIPDGTASQFLGPGTVGGMGSPTAAQFGSEPPRAVVGSPTAAQFAGPGGAGGDLTRAPTAIAGFTVASAEARASTQLEAETPPPPPKKSGAGAVAAALVVLAVGGAAGGLFLLRGSGGPAQAASEAVDPAPSAVAPPTASAIAPTVAPTAPASAPATPPGKVRLEVATDPPGAVVTKNGFQVCDLTPCEVLANIDETFELEASKEKLRGKVKVLAQRDQRVSIKLDAPVAGGGGPPGPRPPQPPKPRLCEVEVDGIKILRPCP